MALDLLAGIPVAGYGAALPWYERFFGGRPSFLPKEAEAAQRFAARQRLSLCACMPVRQWQPNAYRRSARGRERFEAHPQGAPNWLACASAGWSRPACTAGPGVTTASLGPARARPIAGGPANP
jgi:hypothetical protein